jgi:DNA polymerase III delta subunit
MVEFYKSTWQNREMKYKDTNSFDNHIKKSFPDHISQGFAFLVQSPEDRRHFIDCLVNTLSHFFPRREVQRHDKDQLNLSDIAEKLDSLSLFHQTTIHIFDPLDEADPAFLDLLKKVILQSRKGCFFVFGASKKEKIMNLYGALKKELIILDLSEEKPWHRKERLISQILLYGKKAGKVLEPALIDRLLNSCQMNLPLLLTNIDKCLLFAKDKECITLSHVEEILPQNPEEKMWDLAEQVVWSKQIIQLQQELDLFAFLGAIRYHLQLGLKISEKILKSNQVLPEDFPKVNKNRLPLFTDKVRILGVPYFQKGIVYLFELELKAKTFLDPKKGLDLLIFHFQKEKYHAASFAQLNR